MEAANEPGVLTSELRADGSQAGILCAAGRLSHGAIEGQPFLTMDGPAVFKLAVSVLDTSAVDVLTAAGLPTEPLAERLDAGIRRTYASWPRSRAASVCPIPRSS